MDVANGNGWPLLPMAGFTLVEALAVVCVVGVVAAIGYPSLNETMERTRARTLVHQLGTDMASARMRAITRRTQVVLCPREPGTVRCTETSDWGHGWLLFDDPAGLRQPASEADVLRIAGPAVGTLRVASTRPYLRYQSDGRSAHSNLSVNVCARQKLAGRVVVNNLGRVRSERLPSTMPCPIR